MPERPLASSAAARTAVTAQHRHTHRNQCHKAGHSTTPLSASAQSRQDSSRAPSLPRLSHTPETPYVDTRCSTRGPLHGSVNARKSDPNQTKTRPKPDQNQTPRPHHLACNVTYARTRQRALRTVACRIHVDTTPLPYSQPRTATQLDPAKSTRKLQAVPVVPCKTRPGHLYKTLQM